MFLFSFAKEHIGCIKPLATRVAEEIMHRIFFYVWVIMTLFAEASYIYFACKLINTNELRRCMNSTNRTVEPTSLLSKLHALETEGTSKVNWGTFKENGTFARQRSRTPSTRVFGSTVFFPLFA